MLVGMGKMVQCKYCNKIVSGVIFRFKNHLACTRRDVEGCTSVSSEVKEQVLSILVKMAELTEKKRKQIHGIEDSDDEEVNQIAYKKRERNAMDIFFKKKSSGSGSGTGTSTNQPTMNQFFKKELREDCCQQIARFFYTSAIPFNCVKNPELAKMVELIGRYGIGLKPPSYHELRETYLKKEVARTMEMLEEYEAE